MFTIEWADILVVTALDGGGAWGKFLDSFSLSMRVF